MNLTYSSDAIVVDPHLDDYCNLVSDYAAGTVRFQFFSAGERALASAGVSTEALWLVNMRLSDMPGVDLLAIIRQRAFWARVFLVGEAYDPHEELAARTAGATAYVCKPPDATWLDHLGHAVRAGPTAVGRPAHAAIRPTTNMPPPARVGKSYPPSRTQLSQ